MKNLVMSIDCGTQSLRVMIFDSKGHLLAIEKEEYEPYYANKIGICEKNPNDYFDAFINCCDRLMKTKYYNHVSSIIVTTLRDTGVFLDENGDVIRNSILFLDKREAKKVFDIPLIYAIPSKLVGMYEPIIESKKQGKTNWIIENEPEIWKRTKHYLLLSGFFNYKLTGKFVDSISNQIGHIPINFKRRKWDRKGGLYDSLFPMSRKILPNLVCTGTIIGVLQKEVADRLNLPHTTKVIAGSSDKGCETLGSGCLDETSISLSFGTAATIQTTTKKYIEPIPFLPSYPAAIDGRYNPEIQIYRGYWMIRWFKEEFSAEEVNLAKKLGTSPEEVLNERISKIPAGANGLLLQPYWKPDLKTPHARGSIIGFTDLHNKYHIYRAIIEGINFGLYDGMKKIERKTKKEITTIYVSGGGSKSDLICQITADMFGIKVVRGETYENSGLGSAVIAYVALGQYKNYEDAIKNMVRATKIFKPDEKTNNLYKTIYNNRYKKIYPRLKSIYKHMKVVDNE